jgi:hypothetical protein
LLSTTTRLQHDEAAGPLDYILGSSQRLSIELKYMPYRKMGSEKISNMPQTYGEDVVFHQVRPSLIGSTTRTTPKTSTRLRFTISNIVGV